MVTVGIRDDGTEVAVKRVIKWASACFKNELNTLRLPELDHENIVKYKVYIIIYLFIRAYSNLYNEI